MEQPWAVVLAAGEGKRMHSRLPKVLHPLCGRPMLAYILESAAALTDRVLVVVGHGASQVQDAIGDCWHYVRQEQQLGTGHAVMQAVKHLPPRGVLFVLCGDTPLLDKEHLERLLAAQAGRAVVVATTILNDPAGYGRIIRGKDDIVERIVEDKEAGTEQKKINEINTGTYCFDLALLKEYLPRLSAENVQKEYYLTDVVDLMRRDGHAASAFLIEDYRVGLGINDRVQLAGAAALIRKQINEKMMISGVTIEDPASTYIDQEVTIGPDTLIRPHCLIENGTVIGSRCRIGPGAHLRRAVLGEEVSVQQSTIFDSAIPCGARIGPFTYISGES